MPRRDHPLGGETRAVRDERAARLIAEIEAADKRALQHRWAELFAQPPPRRSRKNLLRRAIAYEEQTRLFGGLTDATRRRLERLASGTSDPVGPNLRLKPGTRLLRQWQGETHHVTVLQDGFDYRGARHRSLSEIARRITGTRWSGPLFFGLRRAAR